ncbi:MAG: 4Fe-4S binding protein, partial [Synergistaceae bacterium]|nr:4Fe-4S binding protein [Synergistaceae bacterium]
ERKDPQRKDYIGMSKAAIDSTLCINCGECLKHCRFDAISVKNETHVVNPFACEGCAVCQLVCPVNAISFYPNVAGSLNLYKDKEKVFSTAQLKMGNGTTGLLVSEVKKQLNNEAQDTDFAIIDGSPGIGCPVIASISGVEMVLVVAEPSISGISDMVRVIEVSQSFGVKIAVCINKYDANKEKTREIIDYCDRNKIPFVGNIPYDSLATRALNSGLSIVEMACSSGTAVRNVYRRTMQIFSS